MSAPRAKATLIALCLLFIGPMVLAWLLYTGVIDYAPRETTNRGILIQPATEAELPEEFERRGLADHWVMVYPVSPTCGDACRKDLVGLRQVRRALGREAKRIRIVPLFAEIPDAALVQEIEAIDPGFSMVTAAEGLSSQLGDIHGGRGAFLIDPLGKIMMHYAPGFDPNNIRLDLERLLKYTKTDPQE